MKDTLMTLILFLFGVGIGHSQERRSEICVDFRLNSMVIDPSYSDNAIRMQELVEFLRNIRQDSTIHIVEVSFCGATSPESDTLIVEPIMEVAAIVPETAHIVEMEMPEAEEWARMFYLKTNALGLGLAIANIAVEVDLAKHWSFTLPVYYSAWDYFKTTVKFRTFAVQPELRYWWSEENEGFFAGAHFGLAYYNFALDGEYRYQDHYRRTPAIGGGMSAGYRMAISKSNSWWVEFTLGAGVYPLHYDKFYNTPRTKDGALIESIKKTYWGIDQVAVSFSYSFDLTRRGGKR